MAYRVLLPSVRPITADRLEDALHDLDVVRVSRSQLRWLVRDLASGLDHDAGARLLVEIKGRSEVQQEPFDRYFFTPHGVQCWVEVRVSRGPVDRQARLHARLIALGLSERLRLLAVETRNGVYCRTPEAYAAWCSREVHPDTALLAERDHVTVAPPSRLGVRRPPAPEQVADAGPQAMPLPTDGGLAGWWHRVTHAKPYMIPLPARVESHVVQALVQEIIGTFQRHNVVHDVEGHRLIVYAKDTRGARDTVNYFRRRAHPERLRRTSGALRT